MSNCNITGFLEGGKLVDPEISNPTIIGGTATNLTLNNATLEGTINIAADTAEALAGLLCQYLDDCLTIPAETIAGVFNTCAGAPHTAGANIPTCLEMNTAITTAVNEAVTALPTPENILGMLKTCAGSSHEPGNAVPTCAETSAIATEIVNDAISDVLGDLSLTVATQTPSTNEAEPIPTTLITNKTTRAMIMGEPDGYLVYTLVGGARTLIPYFNYSECE